MALARVKSPNPGDTILAADYNAEFNNILNNPISLVSPTTGAINFQTSVAHTNLTPSAITASSGFSGSVLIGSTAGTPVPLWSTGATAGGVFVATTASVPTWSTAASLGGVLIATTSGLPTWSTGATAGGVLVATTAALPTWTAAAPTGGSLIATTSGNPQWAAASAGGLLIASTVALPRWLAIGTSGQVITAGTSGAPLWSANPSGFIQAATTIATSAGANFVTSSTTFVTVTSVSLTLIPNTTAARFLINAGFGVAVTSSNAQVGWDILFDATRLGNATFGLQRQYFNMGASMWILGTINLVTSVVSTASHTAALQVAVVDTSGSGASVQIGGNPGSQFSMVELNTSG